ncbi:hypothetical protein D3C76_51520 [compost metagenome]
MKVIAPAEDVKDFAQKAQELLTLNPNAFYYIKGYTDCVMKTSKENAVAEKAATNELKPKKSVAV